MSMPAKKEMPATIKRSPVKAQKTYAETLDSAVDEYGDGERAHRTAFSSLKHSFEKVGDHWEEKEGGHKGPSDDQAASTGAAARRGGRIGDAREAREARRQGAGAGRRGLDAARRDGLADAGDVEPLDLIRVGDGP